MITRAMREGLRARGYDEEQIRQMRPAEAHAILAGDPAGARPNGGADLGERVRAAREARGLSQRALAQLADTSQTKVSSIERGIPIKADTAARICAALGLD